MAKLTITVGASVDRSLSVAFQPLIESAKRAKAAIDAEAKKGARAISTETRKGVNDAEAKFRELERQIEGGLPKAFNTGTSAIKGFSKDTATHFAAVRKNFADLTRDAESAMGRIAKTQKAFAVAGVAPVRRGPSLASWAYDAAGGTKGVKAGLNRGGRIALGVGKAAAGAAADIGLSYARGVGVNTDLSSIFGKNADLEAQATALSNSGVIAGDKRNSARVDPTQLMQDALSVGKATGTDANEALEGLSKFTAKTGDLQTGREVMKDLAMFAKATGTELDDMVDAAGDVASALPEGTDKAKGILTVMRSIAAQGKLGAVEIKDLATQMAKLAANAGQIEGNAADNIVLLGAFTQEARQRGGATSATMAATSVAGLINTFKTPARAKAFEVATGKKVFNDEGQIRNPQTLLLEALRSSGMDPLGFKKIFSNVAGGRAVEGFATIYRQAGGGEKGEAAVVAEFERLKKAALDDAEVMQSFAAQMKTSKSQAEIFNQTIRESAMRLQQDLLPAAVALAPVLTELAVKTGNVIGWLIGAEERKIADKEKDANKNVNDALVNTKKQMDQGYLLDGQQKVNEKAQLDAKWLVEQTSEDEKRAKRDKTGGFMRAVGAVDDATSIWTLFGGKGHKQANAEEDAKIETTQTAAAAAKEQLDEIKASNQLVAQYLEQGILKVRVVEPVPGNGLGPPGTPSNGRQPSPEEKNQ